MLSWELIWDWIFSNWDWLLIRWILISILVGLIVGAAFAFSGGEDKED